MIDASSVGMLNCIVKKTDLFFIMKWKKDKKELRVDFFLIYFFLLVMMTPMVCHAVSSLED